MQCNGKVPADAGMAGCRESGTGSVTPKYVVSTMRFRQLGQTDLEVSAIAFGCWAIVGDGTWGHQDKNDAIAALRTAMDVGVNLWQAESRIQ